MKHFLTKLFATGFFVGFIPVAPGTFGTLLGAAIWWFVPSKLPFTIILLSFLLISFLVSGGAEKLFNKKDDQRIVIDEVVGFFFSVIFLPKTIFVLISGIVLFRFFDIKKPFFIKSVQEWKGSAGVVADDLLAGIITNLILQIAIRFIHC